MPPPSRLATNNATSSGSTTTVEQAPSIPLNRTHGTLVLRAEPVEERHIQWAEDVVDNEGMGKKSSKVCCIYHRPTAVDESSGDDSSDNSSSSSDGDSDSGDDGRARPVGGDRGRKSKKSHKHKHGCDDHDHDHDHDSGSGQGKGKARARKRSPNAYEKMPNYSKKPEGSS